MSLSWLLLLSSPAQAAGSATLSLVPSSGSYNINDVFTVTVHEDSGAEAINAVESDLIYDAAKLQYVSIDANTSAFDLSANSSAGSGIVKIARATSGAPLTGDQTVISVTFKALVGSGTTPINFATCDTQAQPNCTSSAIVRYSDTTDIWNHVITGGTYTLTGDTTAAPGTTSSTTTTSSSSSARRTRATAATVLPLTLTVPTTPISSTTKTYLVAVRLLNSRSKPVVGAHVTLHSDPQTATTDNTGVASFINVPAGEHSVDIVSGRTHLTKTINVVASDQLQTVQDFAIVLAMSRTAQILWLIGLLLILVIIAGGGISLGRALIKHQPHLGAEVSSTKTIMTPTTAAAANGAPTSVAVAGPTVAAPTPPPAAPTPTPPSPPVAATPDINPTGQVFYPDPNIQHLTGKPTDWQSEEETNG